MRISTSMRWLVVAVSAAMLLAVAAACSSETVEVPGETVVVEKGGHQDSRGSGRDRRSRRSSKRCMVPGETVVVEGRGRQPRPSMVPGETVVVERRW